MISRTSSRAVRLSSVNISINLFKIKHGDVGTIRGMLSLLNPSTILYVQIYFYFSTTLFRSLPCLSVGHDVQCPTFCLRMLCLGSSPYFSLFRHRCLLVSDGEFLVPDEVTFAVLLRGYGAKTPPDWPRIDATLSTMRNKFGVTPTASECTHESTSLSQVWYIIWVLC
jgi:hypothetical protein